MSFGSRDGGVVVKWVVSVLVVLLAALVVFIVWASRDIEMPDDSDLVPVRREVADEANAYVAFLAATNLLVKGEFGSGACLSQCRKMVNGSEPWDGDLVAETLSTNAAFMAAVEESLSLSLYQSPELADIMGLLPHVSYLMAAGRLFELQASVDARAGRFQSAASSSATALRLGELQLQEPSSLVEGLVGLALCASGQRAYLRMAQQGVPLTQLRAWRLRDGGWLVDNASATATYKAEYVVAKGSIVLMKTMPIRSISEMTSMADTDEENGSWLGNQKIPALVYHPNRTVAMFGETYRQILGEIELPVRERDTALLEGIVEDRRHGIFRKRNPVGNILFSLLLPSMDAALDKWPQHNIVTESIELVAALHAYRRDEGALPEMLDALVPGYLAAVPVDLFDGEPMKYDRERGIVYSVGRDRVDDGGSYDAENTRSVSQGRTGKDLVILIDRRATGEE